VFHPFSHLRSILAAVMLVFAQSIPFTAAPPPVALDIRGQTGSALFSTRARVTVEPHPGNRTLCVQWEQIQGGSGYRNSCQDWVGDTAPITHWQIIKDLPSGRWMVRAYVIRNDEKAYPSLPITLHVLGPNYEPEPEL
jgi:hypothetical protein